MNAIEADLEQGFIPALAAPGRAPRGAGRMDHAAA